MRKKFFVVAVLVIVAAFTFGQGMSVGAGLGWAPYWITIRQTLGSSWVQEQQTSSAFGGQVYLDATYVQASIGYFGTGSNYTLSASDSAGENASMSETNGDEGGWLILSVLGKYPFHLWGFTLFPLAGFEYDLNLSYTDSNGNDLKSGMTSEELSSLNQFWFKFGVGADFPVSSAMYIRPTILGGLKFLSQEDNDEITALELANGGTFKLTYFRLDVGVSVGYKF
jgi:hypothetical protein